MKGAPVLVKIGGTAAEKKSAIASLAAEIGTLSAEHRFLIVHGGGAEVTALSKRLGIESVFVQGLRQTSEAEMDVVEMVLSGKVNKALVRSLRMCGLNAVGVSGTDGGIISGFSIGNLPDGARSRTGEVSGADGRLVSLLLDNGYLPVVSPPAMDAEGLALNINADTAAFSLAVALSCSALVFLSDIPGIISDGTVIHELTTAEARALCARGVITGGMLPKVTASVDAIGRGVETVIIGQYEEQGSLSALLEGKKGTRIWK